MKTPTAVIIISVIFILAIAFLSFSDLGFATAEKQSPEYTHSWTKAVCNETQCQDYEIYCNGNELINQTAITGAVIAIGNGWADPRGEINQNDIC